MLRISIWLGAKITWGLVAVAGASLVSGVMGSDAAKSAAEAQSQAAQTAAQAQLQATTQSNQLQAQMYQQGLINQSPYMQSGNEALAALTAGMGLNNYGVGGGNNTQYGGGGYNTGIAPPNGYSAAGIPNLAGQGGTSISSDPNLQSAMQMSGGGRGGSFNIGNGTANGINPIMGSVNGGGVMMNPLTQGTASSTGPQVISTNSGGTQTTNAPGSATNAQIDPNSLKQGTAGQMLGLNNYGASNAAMQGAAANYMTPGGQGVFTQTFSPSDLTLSPAYQFQLQQGTANLNASAAANGTLGSGQNLKDITNYGQNAAQNAYQAAYSNFNQNQNQAISRLQSLAGIGQGSANTLSSSGSTTAGNIANTTMAGTAASNNYLTGAAAANAAGQIGQANAWSSALNSGVNGVMGMNYLQGLNKNPGGVTTTYPTNTGGLGGGSGFNAPGAAGSTTGGIGADLQY